MLEKLRVRSNIKRLVKGTGKQKHTIKITRNLIRLGSNYTIDHLIKILDDISSVSDKSFNIYRDNTSEQSVVYKAATVLGQLGDLRAVEPLINVSKFFVNNKSVTCTIIRSLGQLRNASSIEALINYLDFNSPEVREAAFKELMRACKAISLDSLIAALESTSSDKRVAVIKILGESGKTSSVKLLIPLLGESKDVGSELRKATAAALSKLGQPKWLNYIKGDKYDFVRLGKSGDRRMIGVLIKASIDYPIESAEGLMRLGYPRATEILIRKLDSYERCFKYSQESISTNHTELYINECLETLAVLAKMGDVRLAGPVSKMLNCTQNPAIIQAVAKTLSQIGTASSVNRLVKHLTHWNKNVRVTVADSLAKLGDPKWLNCVQGNDEDFIHLGKSGDPQIFGPLINAADYNYKYSNGKISRKIVDVLSGEADAFEPLINILNHESNNATGRIAAECLGRSGDLRAVKPLINALNNSTYEGLKAVVAKSLGKLKDARAIRHLENVLLSDSAGWVKEAAIESLRLLGETTLIEIIEHEDELFHAARNNDVEKFALLLDFVDPANCVSLSKGETLLHDICRSNSNSSHIINTIIERVIDVNSKNDNLETPLHLACLFGLEVATKTLIENGADVNIRDKWGKTPLHNTAYHLNYENAKLLLKSGAEVNLTDKNNNTPLYVLWNSHEGLELELKQKIGELFVKYGGVINRH